MMTDRACSLGYASRAYAESLSEFGALVHLPRCGGFLLKRSIPGTSEQDAMGTYPLFFCEDWSLLAADLAELPEEIVSVSLVADPLGGHTPEWLAKTFDVVNPFKKHYLVDLARPAEEIGSKHHRREARKALKKNQVEVCLEPVGFLDEWTRLYETLAQQHGIRGIQAFSRSTFQKQLAMPEIVVHQAYYEGRVVGAQLFFVQGDVVHCHLGAVSAEGYATGAFYALDHFSFGYFSGRAKWLDLGGGAGVCTSDSDGLSRYKQGWSTQTLPVFFCGRITNPAKYAVLASQKNEPTAEYFPVYRQGEFS